MMIKLQTKRPNIKNHIAIYYPGSITTDTMQDTCIREILELCGDYNFSMNFTYAIYTDHSLIAENIFIPIFHTFYLNSEPKMVVIRDKLPIDIMELYPYHDFYFYENDNENIDLLKEKFPNHKINIITSLKDLI